MGHKHPNSHELYTPITPEVQQLFLRMKAEHGNWRRVAAVSKTRLKVLRIVRNAERKTVSQRLLDRICTTTEVGSIDEFPWYTPEELVSLGIWEPIQYVEGDKRIHDGFVSYGTNKKNQFLTKGQRRWRKKKAEEEWFVAPDAFGNSEEIPELDPPGK